MSKDHGRRKVTINPECLAGAKRTLAIGRLRFAALNEIKANRDFPGLFFSQVFDDAGPNVAAIIHAE